MNKAEKSLRWVVNQIPDFKPTTNEEKMLLAIKLYSEGGAEEIKRLEVENAALRERLEKTVEVPSIEEHFFGEVAYYALVYRNKNGYVHTEVYDKPEEADAHLAELKGEKE